MYEYRAREDNQLSFKAGDKINILYQLENGWTLAELNGKKGYVPSNHIEIQKKQIKGIPFTGAIIGKKIGSVSTTTFYSQSVVPAKPQNIPYVQPQPMPGYAGIAADQESIERMLASRRHGF